MRSTISRQIIGATFTVALSTALVALTFIPRELLVAARFGTSDAADAFVFSLGIPTYAIAVLGGSIPAAFVPVFVRLTDHDGPKEATRLLRGLTAVVLGLFVVAALLLGLTATALLPVIASGFAETKLAETRHILLALLVLIPIGGLSALWAAALNARTSFALPTLSQALIPLGAVAALLLAPGASIDALVGGTIIGFVLRAAVLWWALIRAGQPLRPSITGMTPALREVLTQYLQLALAAFLLGSTAIIDQVVAASLPAGNVAALSYGTKIIVLITGLTTSALGTAVLPYFSRLVAEKQFAQLRSTVRTFAWLALAATVPAMLLLILLSPQLVEFMFQRQSFSAADTVVVARIQAFGAVQLPFFSVGIIFVRLISSLGANALLLAQTAIALVVAAVLDVLLAMWIGVEGIAMSTSIMYAVSMCVLIAMSHHALARAERNAQQGSAGGDLLAAR